ncbi:MAG TPA: ABC-2 family transporter protein [Candidatus Eisenbergiella merdavium]|uniref:ABC-2 family transporter protein n=1 Tax=Candidatus Eisenbergiella merdavium TaxID=2838551 RepID=A0A9D2SRV2_9FIRM|nr:ABC-2 family transporter protein [Candidatus Eisenbergiella merdavium]
MAFLIVSFKSRITYRSSALFATAGSIIDILIKLALWTYLYRNSREMTEYMIMYTVLSNVISLFYINKIAQLIGDKITDGSITADLMKPYHFILSNYMQCLGELLANFLLKGLPIILVFSVSIYKHAGSIVMRQLPAALFAVVMGHFLYVLIFIIIGMSAMAFLEIWAIQRIIRDIIQFLSGAFIPLSLFPDALYRINLFLPFRFLFSFPLELMLNEWPPSAMWGNFGILSLWLILLVMLVCILEKYLTKKLIVQGG